MQNFTAFTKEEKGLVPVLKTEVSIEVDKKLNPNCNDFGTKYVAIWDTGATSTVISERLAQKLGLTSVGLTKVSTANGIAEANQYILDLILPNKVKIARVMMTAGKLDANTDFLIGMNIITLGDFSITNLNGKTTFTFRIPSCEIIDYVKEAKCLQKKELEKQLKAMQSELKKGGKCSCGSGKPFRYCHGKKQIEQIQKDLEKLSV